MNDEENDFSNNLLEDIRNTNFSSQSYSNNESTTSSEESSNIDAGDHIHQEDTYTLIEDEESFSQVTHHFGDGDNLANNCIFCTAYI